jgi:hypothetical protein
MRRGLVLTILAVAALTGFPAAAAAGPDDPIVYIGITDGWYYFDGFASPAVAYPGTASMKAGEGVPLKFSLHGDQGSSILASGSPGWIPCGALDGSTPAEGALSYNASSDRYTYLATSAKSWAGSCRDLIVTLRDGTTHRARFSFTK